MRRMSLAILAVAIASGLGACSSAASGLTGATWQWSHLSENNPKHQSVVPDPASYTITFDADGHFQARADCNQVSGSYTTNGSSITLTVGPTTLVACPPGSLGDQYVALLQQVAGYSIDGTNLTLLLENDAGEMGFVQAT